MVDKGPLCMPPCEQEPTGVPIQHVGGSCTWSTPQAHPPLPPPGSPPRQDFEGGSLYGLEKFWAFHHYTGFPRDQPELEMLPKVRWAGLVARWHELCSSVVGALSACCTKAPSSHGRRSILHGPPAQPLMQPFHANSERCTSGVESKNLHQDLF